MLLLSHVLSDAVGDLEQLPGAALDALLFPASQDLGREVVDAVAEAAAHDEGVQRQELLGLGGEGGAGGPAGRTCFSSMYWTIFCRSLAGSWLMSMSARGAEAGSGRVKWPVFIEMAGGMEC